MCTQLNEQRQGKNVTGQLTLALPSCSGRVHRRIRRIRGDHPAGLGLGWPQPSSHPPVSLPGRLAGVTEGSHSSRCEEAGCGGLLRPHVVWFGENLDPAILEEVDRELALCDLCLVVGHTLP